MDRKKVDWVVITETWLGEVAGGSTKPWESDLSLASLVSTKRPVGSAGRFHGGLALLCNDKVLARRQTKLISSDINARWAVWKIDDTYACGCYFGVSVSILQIEESLDQIERVFRDLGPGKSFAFLGDLNANFKHSDGSYRDDERGRLFGSWFEKMGLILQEPKDGDSFNTTVGRTEGSRWRDVIAVNSKLLPETIDIEIDLNESYTSDHYPVIMNCIDTQSRGTPKVFKRKAWKLSRLFDEEIRQEYLNNLQSAFEPMHHAVAHESPSVVAQGEEGRQVFIDTICQKFVAAFDEASDKSLPRLTEYKGQDRKCKSPEVLRLRELLQKARVKSVNIRYTREDRRVACKTIKKDITIAMAKEMNERWHQSFVYELDGMEVGEYLGNLRRIRRGRQKGTSPGFRGYFH